MEPNPKTIEAWNAKARAYDRLCHHWEIFGKVSRRLIDLLPADLNGAVLDIGAGTGLTSEALLERHAKCEAVLIEPAAEMLELARRNLAAMQAHRRMVRPARLLNMGLGEVTLDEPAVAAAASFSMQFLKLDEAFRTLAKLLAPGSHVAFSLWYHHWEETASIPGMRNWRNYVEVACREANLLPAADSASKAQPAKTRLELESVCRKQGYRIVSIQRYEDRTPSAFGVDDEAMSPDWPLPGLPAETRAALIERMYELAEGEFEPLVSTTFLLQKIQ